MEFYHEEDTSRLRHVVGWIVDLAVVIALACYMVHCFGMQITVNGSSMNPILSSGDVALLNRLAYELGEPRRFDIAVFERPDSELQIKRIIGLPGETVQIRDNRIYINDELLETAEGLDTVTIAGLAEYPIELGNDEYFLLGDNRESSEDSRFASTGNVKRSQLLGKLWLKFQPFSELGLV